MIETVAGKRGTASRRPRRGTVLSPNVHRLERIASAGAATWLLTGGRQSWQSRDDAWGKAAPWVAGALLFRALTGYSSVYAALGTGTRSTDSKRALAGRGGLHVLETITVNRPPAEVYALWRKLENLPRYMSHLESVHELDERRSHWVTKAIGGMRLEWDAEIVNEEPGKVIGWRSLDNADVVSAGSVNFCEAPDGRGTELVVHLQYDPPGGKLGGYAAKLLGDDPRAQIREDLRRFKRWLETGAPPTVSGQSTGRRSVLGRMLRPSESGSGLNA